MIKIRENSMVAYNDGSVYVEAVTDDATELAEFVDVGDADIADGGIAWCVPTGKWYGFCGGAWYGQDGSGAVSSAKSSKKSGGKPETIPEDFEK